MKRMDNLYAAASRQYNLRNYPEAFRYYEEILKLDQDQYDALQGRGASYRMLGKHEEALLDFNRVLEKHPENESVLAQRGAIYRMLGKYTEALADFNKVLFKIPKNGFALEQRGATYRKLENFLEALVDFDDALKIDPSSTFAIQGRASVCRHLNNYQDAIDNLNNILKTDPSNIFALKERANAYFLLNQYKNVCIDCQKILEIAPHGKEDVRALFKKAFKQLELQNDSLCRYVVELTYNEWTTLNLNSQSLEQINLNNSFTDSFVQEPHTNQPSGTLSFQRKNTVDFKISYSQLSIFRDYKLGSGSYSVVYQGIYDGQTVAIKQLKNPNLPSTPRSLGSFEREAAIMTRLDSPYIVKVHGVCIEEIPRFIVMEYMPRGSLFSILHNGKDLPWSQRKNIALDVAKGLDYLHDKEVLHRDLKSPNVLLDNNFNAKLTDFGFAKIKTSSIVKSDQAIGTLQWMAPELFKGGNTSKKSDIYSYGVILWELASRKIPLSDDDNHLARIFARVTEGNRDVIPESTPLKIAALIKSCWQKDQIDRPNTKEIITELNKEIEIESKLLGLTLS